MICVTLCGAAGGEVTGSIDEKVRHAVTKLSNLHFVANQQAADRRPSNAMSCHARPG